MRILVVYSAVGLPRDPHGSQTNINVVNFPGSPKNIKFFKKHTLIGKGAKTVIRGNNKRARQPRARSIVGYCVRYTTTEDATNALTGSLSVTVFSENVLTVLLS